VKHGLTAPLLGAVMRSPLLRDLLARLVAYALALVLLAVAFGFLVATLYLGLAEVVEPPLAALLTALVLGAVAALLLLRARYRRRRMAPAGTVGVDALLLSLSDQVRRDPWSTLAIAAVLGALAEFTHSSSSRPPP
jgi:type VI protein secretion system component VasK